MDWILERTVHKSLVVARQGEEVYSDLDYANDVAFKMLGVSILSLEIMQHKASPFSLEINGTKSKHP